ncbi:AAA family ATPase [Candidatus Micrarchaeota archaeon]|nr:AAA family ATPase [Candidatus Micrarchaeota archaeon]
MTRIPTGIPGFDELIEGGFDENSTNIIVGSAGTGKTIFALNFLYNGITKYKENGIYISLEEKKERVYVHTERFGWNLEDLEKKNKFVFVHYPAQQIEKFIEDAPYLKDLIKEHKIKRVVIDSATSLMLLQKDAYARRQIFLKLMSIISGWGCTVLLTSEGTQKGDRLVPKFNIEYLVDGVVAVHTVRKGDVKDKALEIVKMRGTKHSHRLVPMKIVKEGIAVYPTQGVFNK